MANHVRRQIREAVVTLLTGLTSTASRVYDSRVYEIKTLPALVVYATEESSERSDLSGKMDRTVMVRVECYAKVKSSGSVEDVIDTIAKEVEIAMDADQTFGGLALASMLENTNIELTGDGEKPVAVMTLEYQVLYRTAKGSPDVSV